MMISPFTYLPKNFYSNPHTGCYIDAMDEGQQLVMEKLLNIYLARFVYEDLPDEMAETIGNFNYFDSVLFFNPSGAFLKTSEYGIQFLPTTGAYKYNVIGRPVEWNCFGYNGFHQKATVDDSVLMINDNVATIPFLHLFHETRYMRELEHTIEQNIMAQRQPYIIEGDPDVKKSVDRFWEHLSNFEPMIFQKEANKRSPENIETKVFQTNVPFQTADYMDAYNEFFNRCLTYLGINNINVQSKKERLIVSEAASNDIVIQTDFTAALRQREYSIEHANKMFGTHMKVRPADLETLQAAVNQAMEEISKNIGGSSDGTGAPVQQDKNNA